MSKIHKFSIGETNEMAELVSRQTKRPSSKGITPFFSKTINKSPNRVKLGLTKSSKGSLCSNKTVTPIIMKPENQNFGNVSLLQKRQRKTSISSRLNEGVINLGKRSSKQLHCQPKR